MSDVNGINCLLCGGGAGLVFAAHPGYLEPTSFDIYHCGHCNTNFSMPRVDALVVYELIYKNSREIPGYSRYCRYADEIKRINDPLLFLAEQEEMYWAVRESLLQVSLNRVGEFSVLEIGSGLGYLTYALQKAGFDAVGIDTSAEAVAKSRASYGDYYINDDLYRFSQSHNNRYDVVILTEVIEHIENAVDFLSAVKKLLKENGYILVTTPNKGIYPDHAIWKTDSPPIHCWWFSEKSLKFIAEAVGMDVKFIDFTSYYNKHKTFINIKAPYGAYIDKHVLNAEGHVIKNTNVISREIILLKRWWKQFAVKTGLRTILECVGEKSGKLKMCCKEGVTICAIFTVKH